MAIMYHLLHLPMCVRQEKQLEPNVCDDNKNFKVDVVCL